MFILPVKGRKLGRFRNDPASTLVPGMQGKRASVEYVRRLGRQWGRV